jgi:hypothetical protein
MERFVVIAGLAIWEGSFFGEDKPTRAIMIAMGLLFVLAIWVRSTEPEPQLRPLSSRPSSKRFHSKAPIGALAAVIRRPERTAAYGNPGEEAERPI